MYCLAVHPFLRTDTHTFVPAGRSVQNQTVPIFIGTHPNIGLSDIDGQAYPVGIGKGKGRGHGIAPPEDGDGTPVGKIESVSSKLGIQRQLYAVLCDAACSIVKEDHKVGEGGVSRTIGHGGR